MTTAICGSDLHLYEVLTTFMSEGDVLGHEPMGIAEEVSSEVTSIMPGDRVMMPIQISRGHCFMRDQRLQTQCETTQMRYQNMGAALFRYSKLYGEVTVEQADGMTIKVPKARPKKGSCTSSTRFRPRGGPSPTRKYPKTEPSSDSARSGRPCGSEAPGRL